MLPYLDVPFQHGSPRILKLMKRPAHAENTLARIRRWREICPDITLRSTFIVGFPGETEQDFQLLLDWLAEARLDRVGCFRYSPVEGAAANALPDPVPDDVKQERYERFMDARDRDQRRAARGEGRPDDARAGGHDRRGMAPSRARRPMRRRSTARCASRARASSHAGDWADVTITDSSAYDLTAKLARVA